MFQFFEKSLEQLLRLAAVILLFYGLTLNHVAAGETDLDRRLDSCIVTGRVVLSESVTPLRPLIEAQAAVRDAEVCSAEVIPDEPLADPEQRARVEKELGDVLFVVANIARRWKINPEEALRHSNNKFQRRVQYIEQALKKQNKTLAEASLQEMEELYQQGKQQESET